MSVNNRAVLGKVAPDYSHEHADFRLASAPRETLTYVPLSDMPLAEA